MLSIQTNVNSLVAQQNLTINNQFQSRTIQELTSGYRINSSGDDAAGLAVANKFRSNVAELTQGVSNGNDAVAQLQIMDGGMSNISTMLDRLKTLATQSASGTFTGDRTVLNNEFQSVLSEIDRQAQSIGLNTAGTFAKSLAVYLGTGSGSQSLNNGIVTLGLAQSTVDSQSLGLKGLQVVNASSTTGLVTQDIGTSSATSVENIVGNTSGTYANQEALAGYASFLFSGASFSDGGKVAVSVNLSGVSDVATLATAVNNAIQAASTGTSAAADAFKNAGIVASVYTDSNGGQALAFSSSSTAFQVQAGDQMANALMGNVSVQGGSYAQGTAVNTSTVTGRTTTAGSGFTSPTNVHLVVTGGGLASAVSLNLNAADTTTSAAIADLANQFQSDTSLVAAGLTMTNSAGGSNVGGTLSFNSSNGQAFNIQVTGDTQNLLGLGSFLADSLGSADYSTITGGTAYDATAVTGTLGTTQGTAAGLEISLNGAAATAMTAIDLTAGAHATAASATGTTVAGGAVDIGATNNALDISVINNGVVTNWAGTLTSNQVATHGAVSSASINAASSVTVDSTHDKFQISVDGGPAVQVSVANGTYTGTGAGSIVAALNTAIGGTAYAGMVTAGFDTTTGLLTFTSATTGAGSSVALSNSATTNTVNTSAEVSSASINSASSVIVDATHNTFQLAVDGGASVAVTVANGTYTGTGAQDLTTAINTAIGSTALAGLVTAGWDSSTGLLSFTSASSGASSAVAASNGASNDLLSTTAGKKLDIATGTHNSGTTTQVSNDLLSTSVGKKLDIATGSHNSGLADQPSTLSSIAAQIQTGLGASNATVTVVNGKLNIAAATKGANSEVLINTPGANSANTAVGLASATTTAGLNSSIADIVSNLNAQFSANSAWQAAGLQASATGSGGTGVGNYITISSSNGTKFRLNATGSGLATAENVGFGIAGTTFASSSYTTAAKVTSASITQTSTVTVDATHNTFQIAVNGVNSGNPVSVTVANGAYTGGTGASSLVTAINSAIGSTALSGAVTAGWDASTGKLTFTAGSGTGATIALTNGASNDLLSTTAGKKLDITTASSGTGTTVAGATPSATTAMSSLDAYGSSATGAKTFNALQYGDEKQVLTFSATDSTGTLETKSITLQNNATSRAGRSIDDAVAYINQQLQASGTTPALQHIIAVKENVGGVEKINFVSSLASFSVGVGSTGSTDGVNGGTQAMLSGSAYGSAANMAIDTQVGAEEAVTAVTTAVSKLGSAQAVIGKGENQLNYAINLAQSQITNFSSAESQIRDADVAVQAANLSKAQVLQQASIAAMAQANSAPQAVLSLLKG